MDSGVAENALGASILCGIPLALVAALVLTFVRNVLVRRIAYVFFALVMAAILGLWVLRALSDGLFWFVVAPLAAILGWLLWIGYRKEFGGGRDG
jgi:hypothetical protein